MTETARGTASYRAPELLNELRTFSDKVDIWALGCILFELSVKKKAFSSDWDIHEHATRKHKLFIVLPESIESPARKFLKNLIHEMLKINSKQRPTASELHRSFNILSERGANALTIDNDIFLAKISQRSSGHKTNEPESDIDHGLPY